MCENVTTLVNDSKVKAIVVTGAGNFFSGGAEITEFGMAVMMGKEGLKEQMPDGLTQPLHDAIMLLDNSPKTIVAAVNGQALGGGCEVSLGCHYRVASPKAVTGTPEVQLGILPGGQGTQRLPRLTDLPTALSMMLTGQPLKSDKAKKAGIFDELAEGDLIDAAAKMALSKPPRPVSKMKVPHTNKLMAQAGALDQAMIQAEKAAKGMIAPDAIVRCVKAACFSKTFQDGVNVEKAEFEELLFSIQSAALRHAFFSERQASKVPGLKAKGAKPKTVGIVGAGLMGGGIAMCFIQKGVPVVLKDAQQDWLDAGYKKIEANYAGQVKRKRMKEERMKELMGLLKPTLNYEDFKNVDMVIEAVPEIMPLKKEVFAALEKNTKPDALICTNTSGLDIDEIAAVLKDPSRVMGTHFFSPANVMPLLENVKTAKAGPQAIADCMEMGKFISKKAVLVGNCDGFVGNRMVAPYASEAKMVVEEGATIEQVDATIEAFGMAMGPMALGDLVGQELFWKQRKAAGDMNKQTKTYMGPYELVDWLCENNRFGQKTPDKSIGADGRGIFIHKGRTKTVDPEVVAKIEEIRKSKGVTARKVSNEEIVERLFFSMINEGFRILDEGFAERPSDIDIVYLYGYGFPPSKGGPMFYAENYVGLDKLLDKLKGYAKMTKDRYTNNKKYMPVDYFEPSPLLEDCVAAMGKVTPGPGQSLIETVLNGKRKKAAGGSSKL